MAHRDNPIKKNKELSKPMDLMNVGFVGNVGNIDLPQMTDAIVIGSNIGGTRQVTTEEYNGTSWSEQNDLGTTRYSVSRGLGTQTAFIAAGGSSPAAAPVTNSEAYDGTNWTATNAVDRARSYISWFGTSTAGLIVGGANT